MAANLEQETQNVSPALCKPFTNFISFWYFFQFIIDKLPYLCTIEWAMIMKYNANSTPSDSMAKSSFQITSFLGFFCSVLRIEQSSMAC